MTIAVIGAGASGMMAALTAAETPENKILLFERQARVGRKLAVTGNGRCNLTNTGAAPENYHGTQPEFAARTLAAFPPAAALDWFAAHGLLTVTEPGGRVYPLSNAANSVVDVLRFALAQPNITLHTGDAVTAVRRQGRGFVVETEGGQFPAERVIIACGGIAGAKAGGVRDGYTLLQSLGHRRTAPRARAADDRADLSARTQGRACRCARDAHAGPQGARAQRGRGAVYGKGRVRSRHI